MTLSRKFFSSFMAVAIALAAAACGESAPKDAPLVCDDPGTGDQIWKLTGLTLPEADEVVGFDLDDHYTTSAEDPIGCGKPDSEGGVDNQLGTLLGLVKSFLGDTDLNVIIAESIADGSIDVTAVVTGYDGPGDTQALISLSVNGEPVADVQDVCVAVNAAGDIVAKLDSLPITVPDIAIDPDSPPITLTLDLSAVKLDITNPSAGAVTDAVLGGGVLWDDGMGNGLGPDIQVIVDELIGGIDVNSIAGSLLDLGPDGACDTISLGVNAQFTLQ